MNMALNNSIESTLPPIESLEDTASQPFTPNFDTDDSIPLQLNPDPESIYGSPESKIEDERVIARRSEWLNRQRLIEKSTPVYDEAGVLIRRDYDPMVTVWVSGHELLAPAGDSSHEVAGMKPPRQPMKPLVRQPFTEAFVPSDFEAAVLGERIVEATPQDIAINFGASQIVDARDTFLELFGAAAEGQEVTVPIAVADLALANVVARERELGDTLDPEDRILMSGFIRWLKIHNAQHPVRTPKLVA